MNKRNKKEKDNQLDMSLKYSKLEFFYKFLRKTRNIEKNFLALPFWKNAALWAMILSASSTTILSVLLIRKNYNYIPPEIPMIYNSREGIWLNMPKLFIWAFPSGIAILGFINVQLLKKVYYMHKRLTLTICFMLAIIYIMGIIGLNQIINLSIF